MTEISTITGNGTAEEGAKVGQADGAGVGTLVGAAGVNDGAVAGPIIGILVAIETGFVVGSLDRIIGSAVG